MAKRERKQPIIIGAIGDVSPFEYGGSIILDHGDGHPTMVRFEPIDWDLERGQDATECNIYTVYIGKRQLLGDVETKQDVYTLDHYSNHIPWAELSQAPEAFGPYQDTHGLSGVSDFGYAFSGCPYPPHAYTEWWDDSLDDIAICCGQSTDALRKLECSADPIERGYFYGAVASHHGWHELTGGDVDSETIASLRKRWALRFYQARKRGITVYT